MEVIQELVDFECGFEDSLASQFPHVSKDLIDILAKMLEFNPHFRLTAKELLSHKIFDPIRKPENEQCTPGKIKLDFDHTLPKNYTGRIANADVCTFQ